VTGLSSTNKRKIEAVSKWKHWDHHQETCYVTAWRQQEGWRQRSWAAATTRRPNGVHKFLCATTETCLKSDVKPAFQECFRERNYEWFPFKGVRAQRLAHSRGTGYWFTSKSKKTFNGGGLFNLRTVFKYQRKKPQQSIQNHHVRVQHITKSNFCVYLTVSRKKRYSIC